jgi:hypothetical protein
MPIVAIVWIPEDPGALGRTPRPGRSRKPSRLIDFLPLPRPVALGHSARYSRADFHPLLVSLAGGIVMTVETLRSALLWCSILNYVMLLIWALASFFARDWLHRLWRHFFKLSSEQFDMLNFAGLTAYKLGIFLFNIFPCISLYIV